MCLIFDSSDCCKGSLDVFLLVLDVGDTSGLCGADGGDRGRLVQLAESVEQEPGY